MCGLVVRVSGYRYRGLGFDSRRYQIFWVVVGLERGPLSLVSSIEELLESKSSGSGLENRDSTAVGNRYADHVTPLYPQKLALTSPTGGGRSVGMVRSRTEATELLLQAELLVALYSYLPAACTWCVAIAVRLCLIWALMHYFHSVSSKFLVLHCMLN